LPVEKPEIIPSSVDPDFDCVRVDSGTAPPPEPTNDVAPDAATVRLCPDGYVPRRRRAAYRLEGKQIVTEEPPTRNPNPEPLD
jgi:hypothetical protein